MLKSDATPTVTRLHIANGLRALGLSAGSGVMVHSSLKSFGYVEGGAQTVIAALMDVLTPDGTLLMPSFNHGEPFQEGGPGYYDPGSTPTTNGAIPDLFWRMSGVQRSLDPTHPFAAWGKNCRRYTEHHHRTLTMGPASPLGLLWQEDGFGLLLGVGYRANTFHHVVEMTTLAPCLGQRTEVYPVLLPDGRRVPGRAWGYRANLCPIDDSARYQGEMEARGLHRTARIGGCHATLFRLKDNFAVIARLLSEGADGFPPCRECPIRPHQGPQTVPSDWDPANQRPLPGSTAWTY